MKARVPNSENSKNKGNNGKLKVVDGKRKGGFRKKPKLVEIKAFAKDTVNEDFEKRLQKEGDDRSREEILTLLAQDQYINHFNPADIRQYIKVEVANLLREEIIKEIDGIIETTENPEGIAEDTLEKRKAIIYEELINQLEDAKKNLIKTKFGDELSDFYVERMQSTLERYVDEKIKEYEQKMNDELKEEMGFLVESNLFTDGFRFLAEDVLVYTAMSGHGKNEKFSNTENRLRFLELQGKIQDVMSMRRTTEYRAIQILMQEDESLDKGQLYILNTRLKILSKHIEKDTSVKSNEGNR